jgi:RNA polymerase sigma-70 factor (ECF subfamily)
MTAITASGARTAHLFRHIKPPRWKREDDSTGDSAVHWQIWTSSKGRVVTTGRQPRSIDDLVARHYDELRRIAHGYLRRERSAGITLQTTGLVSEAYLRFVTLAGIGPQDRTRFFAVASTTMRRVLVDHARRRARLKRGETPEPVPLYAAEWSLGDDEADELIALDDALVRLEQLDRRSAEVVQHRFFGGLTLEETAEVLGVSAKTVQRDWLAARAWLRKEVARDLGVLSLSEFS